METIVQLITGQLQALCLSIRLLLSFVLPFTAKARALRDARNPMPWMRTVWTGQWLMALGGLILLMFCAECSAKEPAAIFQPQPARSNVLAVLPSGWSVIPSSLEQQRLTAAYFTDPQTQAFILLGTAPNYVDWTDKQGKALREYLAKECLYIWIVPPDFTPQFPHWWNDPPPLPERIFSSGEVRVYCYVSHHIADTNRMDMILKEATLISSPAIRLSWTSWQRDISASLKKRRPGLTIKGLK